MSSFNATEYFEKAALLLVTPQCYNEFFIEYNFLHEQCIKALISKGLGLAIVAGSCMVKVPQILKILQNSSAEGVSFTSVLFDLYAVVAGVAYAYAKQFPFSAWGDALFLLIQSTIITALVLNYNFSSVSAVSFVVAFSGILFGLVGGFTSLEVLWSMQAVSAPIMFIGKLAQAYANYQNGSTGQLSAMMCFMLLFGSTARIFTSIQETGDPIIILIYSLATVGNGLLVSQFIYYYFKGASPSSSSSKAAGKKGGKKSAAKAKKS